MQQERLSKAGVSIKTFLAQPLVVYSFDPVPLTQSTPPMPLRSSSDSLRGDAQITMRQRQLANGLDASPRGFNDIQGGRVVLEDLLRNKVCLVILDDVWDLQHAAAFNVLGPKGRLLTATCIGEVLSDIGAETIPIHKWDLRRPDRSRSQFSPPLQWNAVHLKQWACCQGFRRAIHGAKYGITVCARIHSQHDSLSRCWQGRFRLRLPNDDQHGSDVRVQIAFHIVNHNRRIRLRHTLRPLPRIRLHRRTRHCHIRRTSHRLHPAMPWETGL